MIVYEFKVKGKLNQYQGIDRAIRTCQFVRNSCLRYWMDNRGLGRKELYRYNTELRAMYPFVKDLNSHACQASVERCWSAIAKFFDNCKKNIPGKKGYPRFKKNSRSVEYKQSGWKLIDPKHIQFTDKKGIGKLKLIGTWDLAFYPLEQIKRVRLVRRADGYYCQFCIQVDVKVDVEPTSKNVGLDVGLKEFYTDSDGNTEPNPKFYRNSEKRLNFYQRRVSRKKKGSVNRFKARNKLGRVHLKISRQREEHAKRLARCVILSNDMVAYEDLRIKNLVKNHCLAKFMSDAGWYQFRKWLEYFGKKFGRVTVAVNPAYTSQNCSSCGTTVKKSLSTRTHVCKCGCELDRDGKCLTGKTEKTENVWTQSNPSYVWTESNPLYVWPCPTRQEDPVQPVVDHNAAINILKLALSTTGHVGTWINNPNASGDLGATEVGEILPQQPRSLNEESPGISAVGSVNEVKS